MWGINKVRWRGCDLTPSSKEIFNKKQYYLLKTQLGKVSGQRVRSWRKSVRGPIITPMLFAIILPSGIIRPGTIINAHLFNDHHKAAPLLWYAFLTRELGICIQLVSPTPWAKNKRNLVSILITMNIILRTMLNFMTGVTDAMDCKRVSC